MKSSCLLALLLVLLVAFDTPHSADAQCARTRSGCRRYGGVIASCRLRGRCRRRRCTRRRARRRRSCRCTRYYTRRGYRCRFGRATRPQPVPIAAPVPVAGPSAFCPEVCYYRWALTASRCNRALCYIRPCPGRPNYYRCTAAARGDTPRLPPAIPVQQPLGRCFGGCATRAALQRQGLICNAAFCELVPCGAGVYGCNPRVLAPGVGATSPPVTAAVATVATAPTAATSATAATAAPPGGTGALPPAACENRCRVEFLDAAVACAVRGCKIIACDIAGTNPVVGGFGCVPVTSPGTSLTSDPRPVTIAPTAAPATVPPAGTVAGTVTVATTAAAATTVAAVTTGAVATVATTAAGETTMAAATTVTVSTIGATTATTTTTTITTTTTTAPTTTTASTLSPSASIFEDCTLTRGGSRSSQNAISAPDSSAINVDVTITQDGVLNLAPYLRLVTITCNTDGTIRVQMQPNLADQLDVSRIYPLNSIFVYDRDAFTTPCRLATFPIGASETSSVRAQRRLRERAADVTDVYLRVTGVSGASARDVTLTGTRVSPLSIFSSARIVNSPTTNRMLDTDGMNVTARQSTGNDYEQTITVGSSTFGFDGSIAEANGLQAVDITVTGNGANVKSIYTIRNSHSATYTTTLNRVGDAAVGLTEPALLLSPRAGFPNVNVTPPTARCALPALKFSEFMDVYGHLNVGSASSAGSISVPPTSATYFVADNTFTVTATGLMNSPSVRVDATNPLVATLASAGATTFAPIPNPTTRSAMQFNIDAGLIMASTFFLPSVATSFEGKSIWEWDAVDVGTAIPIMPPAPEVDSSGNCGATPSVSVDNDLIVQDTQVVTLSGDFRGTIGGQTTVQALIPPPPNNVRFDCLY